MTAYDVQDEVAPAGRTNRGLVLLAVLVLFTLAIAASYFWLRPLALELKEARKELPVLYSLGGDFTLPSTLGRDLSLSELRGKVVLLNFGYTSCPDVCPTVLARMRAALKQVPGAAGVQPLFITIDPERDTLEKLKPYLEYFDTTLIGLSGSQAQLNQMAALYKVYMEKQPLESAMGYGFAHNDHIYLLDQQGRVRATFGDSITPDQMAADITRLLN